MSEAGWTRKRPSEPGYYWWRDTDKDGMVTHYERPVHVWQSRESVDEPFQVYTSLTGLPVDIKLVKDVWGEWLGPISPNDRQLGRVAAFKEVVAKLDEKRNATLKEWEEDTNVPKGEHDEKDCDGACDLYSVVTNTLSLVASDIENLAQQAQEER